MRAALRSWVEKVTKPSSAVADGAATDNNADDVVHEGRLFDPTQVPNAVEGDDRCLRKSAGEMCGVLVGHDSVGRAVQDDGGVGDLPRRKASAKVGSACFELRSP